MTDITINEQQNQQSIADVTNNKKKDISVDTLSKLFAKARIADKQTRHRGAESNKPALTKEKAERIIRPLQFQRVVRSICESIADSLGKDYDYCMSAVALDVLQAAAEQHVVELLQAGQQLVLYNGTSTLTPAHLAVVKSKKITLFD